MNKIGPIKTMLRAKSNSVFIVVQSVQNQIEKSKLLISLTVLFSLFEKMTLMAILQY